VVSLAPQRWPTDVKYLWHGLSVFAIDGSKFTLPDSPEIRDYFDPDSGLQNVGKGATIRRPWSQRPSRIPEDTGGPHRDAQQHF